ncbi:MerR family transcriptional regulator [Cereibacter sphaeroides]|nr:MerR family transcriptional regulator [Cereibacter sphaeroides]
MKKAPDAFRTISEVADILDTPAHVLRFWESKFYQIRPVKRAGGRRYYRPDDVALINGIKTLLQDQGLTIRGVQRVLQEQGVKHVATLGGPIAELTEDSDEAEVIDTGVVVSLPDPMRRAAPPVDAVEDADDPIPAPATIPVEEPLSAPETDAYDDALDDQVAAQADTDDAPTLPLDLAFEPVAEAAEAPPAGTELEDEREPAEVLDESPEVMADVMPDRVARSPEPESHEVAAAELTTDPEPLEDEMSLSASDRAMLARHLRGLPRGGLGPRRDRVALLARRIDTLLERMSEASGAGRW